MIDLIFAIKFVHLLAAAAMFGAWLGIAGFMLMAYRSGNPSVVALVAQFVVRIELFVVAAALALQPISGFPLAWAIGLTPLNEFWIDASLALYVVGRCGLAGVAAHRDPPAQHGAAGGARPRHARRRLSAPVPHLVRACGRHSCRHDRAYSADGLAAALGLTRFTRRSLKARAGISRRAPASRCS